MTQAIIEQHKNMYRAALKAQYAMGNILQGEGEMDKVDDIVAWMQEYYIALKSIVAAEDLREWTTEWLAETIAAL